MSRKSIYTEALALKICERISNGESLVSVCRSKDMPVTSTVFKWLTERPEFSEMYARAKEECAEIMADEIVTIADTEEDVNRARVRIDARKWVAAKLKPRKYGDKITQEITGEGGGPLNITVTFVGSANNNP